MNIFANWLFKFLLGWTGGFLNRISQAISTNMAGLNDNFSIIWFPLFLIIVAFGIFMDYITGHKSTKNNKKKFQKNSSKNKQKQAENTAYSLQSDRTQYDGLQYENTQLDNIQLNNVNYDNPQNTYADDYYAADFQNADFTKQFNPNEVYTNETDYQQYENPAYNQYDIQTNDNQFLDEQLSGENYYAYQKYNEYNQNNLNDEQYDEYNQNDLSNQQYYEDELMQEQSLQYSQYQPTQDIQYIGDDYLQEQENPPLEQQNYYNQYTDKQFNDGEIPTEATRNISYIENTKNINKTQTDFEYDADNRYDKQDT